MSLESNDYISPMKSPVPVSEVCEILSRVSDLPRQSITSELSLIAESRLTSLQLISFFSAIEKEYKITLIANGIDLRLLETPAMITERINVLRR